MEALLEAFPLQNSKISYFSSFYCGFLYCILFQQFKLLSHTTLLKWMRSTCTTFFTRSALRDLTSQLQVEWQKRFKTVTALSDHPKKKNPSHLGGFQRNITEEAGTRSADEPAYKAPSVGKSYADGKNTTLGRQDEYTSNSFALSAFHLLQRALPATLILAWVQVLKIHYIGKVLTNLNLTLEWFVSVLTVVNPEKDWCSV